MSRNKRHNPNTPENRHSEYVNNPHYVAKWDEQGQPVLHDRYDLHSDERASGEGMAEPAFHPFKFGPAWGYD